MKLVDVSEFYSPTGGGVRNYVDRKFQAAARLGHELCVIAPGTETRTEARDGGKLIWLKTPQLPFDRNYRMFWGGRDLWRLIDAEAPDVVEGSSPWRGGWLVRQWGGGALKVLFMHADPVAVYPQTLLSGKMAPASIDAMFGWYWAYLRTLNSGFDATVVAGAWLAQRFETHGLANLHTVPFGVETAWFKPGLFDASLRSEMLAQCGLGPDAALLVTVGRHHPEKRVGTLIEAAKLAGRQRPVGHYVIGDGFIRRHIEAKAKTAPHVFLAGWVKDRLLLSRMLASADALLHGSSAETFGFAVAESLSSGTPVVVPAAGGAGDLAAPSYAETYVPGDAADAARAILRMLARERAPMSAAALDAAARIGDLDCHFDRLFSLYADLVRARRKPG